MTPEPAITQERTRCAHCRYPRPCWWVRKPKRTGTTITYPFMWLCIFCHYIDVFEEKGHTA